MGVEGYSLSVGRVWPGWRRLLGSAIVEGVWNLLKSCHL